MSLSTIAKYSSSFLLFSQFSAGAIIPRANPDFGKCAWPTILYRQNVGGIDGWSYLPNSFAHFDHNPDRLIKPIADHICSSLQNKCKAPKATYDICIKATAATTNKEGKAAADAFNAIMMPGNPSPSKSSSATPSGTKAPDTRITFQPKVSVKFSKETVEFPGRIDPIWWHNTYIQSDDNATCDETSRRMPNKHYLSFTCEGAEDTTIDIMRAALNAAVTSTIDNTTIKDDERFFKHHIKREQRCTGGTYPTCTYKEVEMTLVPQTVHIVMSNNIPVPEAPGGKMRFLQGNMRYTITKSVGNQCAVCAFFGAGGSGISASLGIAAAVGRASAMANPAGVILNSVVTIGCLAGCSS
jgi:hypothetical protein